VNQQVLRLGRQVAIAAVGGAGVIAGIMAAPIPGSSGTQPFEVRRSRSRTW
jgi:hypothetical protein